MDQAKSSSILASREDCAYWFLSFHQLGSIIKIGKARRQARVVLSEDEAFEDDSSKQGRKLSDEEVQEKASTYASEEVPRVSTTELSLGTAGGTIIYTRRSVWDFNQNLSLWNKNEIMNVDKQSLLQKKISEKVVEEEIDTQEELKEGFKEPGAKRKKSFPRKSTRKRQKLEEDAEKYELKGFLDIVPREEVPIEVESISTKFPIMDWKTCVLTETFMYYQVFRGDESSKQL
ncbi:hypothetical protein Tco_1020162 [Tanacetum coccineum]|uniref:Uncharacterized protein n=1 Tax=Tanacetum coccineum TaxID=301880 RepID=A0ABQ5G136_9ASTR